jgi:hypothetical protein
MLFHNTSDLSPTVQASSSHFFFSGYFICYISMLLPAGVRGEPKARFLKAPNFPRNLSTRPAAEATGCTMLFSWTVASRKPRSRAGDAGFEKIVASTRFLRPTRAHPLYHLLVCQADEWRSAGADPQHWSPVRRSSNENANNPRLVLTCRFNASLATEALAKEATLERFNAAQPTFRVTSRRISCSTSVKTQINQ